MQSMRGELPTTETRPEGIGRVSTCANEVEADGSEVEPRSRGRHHYPINHESRILCICLHGTYHRPDVTTETTTYPSLNPITHLHTLFRAESTHIPRASGTSLCFLIYIEREDHREETEEFGAGEVIGGEPREGGEGGWDWKWVLGTWLREKETTRCETTSIVYTQHDDMTRPYASQHVI
jgi:hypothetical protein